MRADRLVATLLLIQARGRVTAAELAVELEVSVATARRDLAALSTAGVPVYPQRGRNGGWSLVGGSRTDLTGLTLTEARALFLLTGPASSVAPPVRSALRKLVRALPDTFRADAEAAAGAVVVDPSQWGGRRRSRPELLDQLQDAVVRRCQVTVEYDDRRGHRSQRTVDPWGTRREEQRLVPGRRHAPGAADVSPRPDRPGHDDRRARRTTTRLRALPRLGPGRRGGRAAPVTAHRDGRDRHSPAARPAGPVRPALPAAGRPR